MATGTHFTREDLYALRQDPGDGTRWGQRICNRYRMSNPSLYYGNDRNTQRVLEQMTRDYQL